MKGMVLLSLALRALAPAPAHAETLVFPAGFKWCVATAAHQIEGGNSASDWWDFEPIPSGAACDHYHRLDEDTALLRELGVSQYRFSIEWSRIEPREGEWDWDAIAHYAHELALLKSSGIEPMVTLQHFTLPRWLRAKGGWEWEGAPLAFGRFAELAYHLYGASVRDWITINEPTVHLTLGYLEGVHPPGLKQAFEPMGRAAVGLVKAHALAYRLIHAAAARERRPVRVGIAHHLRVFDPDRRFNPFDRLLARIADRAFNWSVGEAVESGRLRLVIPGALRVNVEIPGLKGSQDFIGINYYSRDHVHFTGPALSRDTFRVPPGAPRNDMGWEIYPEGLYRVLKTAARKFPGKPIMITENGIADSKDSQRARFLRDHLAAMHRAMAEGVPVEGYCHWSLMDNFEWNEGFAPRFGLYEVDYATQRRTLRESGREFQRIIRTGRL